jgi:preprotein translocase SecF subunit
VFNLTRYKYIFFAISGIVIVPGLLAMFIWGLNPGIDFTNGASVDLRFQAPSTGPHAVTVQGVTSVFQSSGAKDVQVLLASPDQSGTVPANQYVFIKFSRPIGNSEVGSVLQKLQDPKAGLPALVQQQNNQPLVHTLWIVTPPNSHGTPYGMMAVAFSKPASAAAVQKALANLPPTDAPPVTSQGTLAGSTATPSATSTAGATPSATATPAATATATATATPATSQTFPVSVTDVLIGQNNQIYTVETQTDLTQTGKMDAILAKLQQQFGFGVYVEQSSEVGPAIASETTFNAILAVIAASVFILAYITFAFRKVGSLRLSARFGACAIIALLHDALVVLGLWAIFGKLFDFKVDTLFLTAVLTVIGFSVHDTIVVFDRIRENLSRRTAETFDQVVNASLVQTMSRSLNTSLTVLLTLSALTLFGGASIREFTLALLIGIASGTYSSIFNASMLLVVWETGEWRQWPIVRSFVRPEQEPVGYRRSLARAGSR